MNTLYLPPVSKKTGGSPLVTEPDEFQMISGKSVENQMNGTQKRIAQGANHSTSSSNERTIRKRFSTLCFVHSFGVTDRAARELSSSSCLTPDTRVSGSAPRSSRESQNQNGEILFETILKIWENTFSLNHVMN